MPDQATNMAIADELRVVEMALPALTTDPTICLAKS
jgi:hypothetical protein